MNMRKIFATAIAGMAILVSANVSSFSQEKKSMGDKLGVNAAESKVNWIGKKPGGEHNGYVKIQSGELLVSKNEVTGGSFVIDLNSIVCLDLSNAEYNGKLVGHLKSADFFDVAKYPTAKFTITKVSKLQAGQAASGSKATHQIEGNLTIKDVTKKVSFPASVSLYNGKITATAPTFTIDRTEWGVNYQSKKIFAELKDQFIHDEITLSIDLITK